MQCETRTLQEIIRRVGGLGGGSKEFGSSKRASKCCRIPLQARFGSGMREHFDTAAMASIVAYMSRYIPHGRGYEHPLRQLCRSGHLWHRTLKLPQRQSDD